MSLNSHAGGIGFLEKLILKPYGRAMAKPLALEVMSSK